MKRFQVMVFVMFTFFLSLTMIPEIASAKVEKQHRTIPTEAKATFMLRPELPKDNIGGLQSGYFNIRVKANQVRRLKIKIFNPTSKLLIVYIQKKDATTNDNASVDYLGTNSIDQHFLPDLGSKFVKIPYKIKLKPNQTKDLIIDINLPKKTFVGQKAMAINLSANQFTENSTVKNHYVYAIGLILNGQHLDQKNYKKLQSPIIKTRLTATKKAAISVKIVNPNPVYFKGTTIKVSLKNERWRFIQYSKKSKGGKIAPSSSFYDDVFLNRKRLVPGVYQLRIMIKNGHYRQTLNKYVEISESDAKYINRRNYQYLKYRNLIFIIALLIGFLGIFWWNLIRLRRKKERNAKVNL